jgi:hypothetical protein
MPRVPLNIDRTALFLIRRYGDNSAVMAFRRMQFSALQSNKTAEGEWRLVLSKVIELHFAKPRGPTH